MTKTMTQDTINRARQWGIDKKLTGPESQSSALIQHDKLQGEVHELVVEIVNDDLEAAQMELGDCAVVLIQIAEHLGKSFEECLEMAVNKISKRTGETIDGQFVKDK